MSNVLDPQVVNRCEINKIHASQLLSHEKTLKKIMFEFGVFLEAVEGLSESLKAAESDSVSKEVVESYKNSKDHLQEFIECIDLTYKDIGDCLIHIYGNFSEEYKNYKLCELCLDEIA